MQYDNRILNESGLKSSLSNLPLLKIEHKIPFEHINADQVEPTIDILLLRAKQRRDDLINLRGPRTFENTMRVLDLLTEELSFAFAIFEHLQSVNRSDELKDNIKKVEGKVSEFNSQTVLSEGVWKTINQYAASEEAKSLSGAKKRFLELTKRNFEREGTNLPAKEKEHLIAINKELKSLTNEFANNVAKDKDAFELIIDDENRLAGLPDSAIALAKASAESKKVSGWRLTLQAPCYMAVMRYMDNAQIREKLYRAYNSIAAKGDNDNTKLLARIIALRNEKAKMLGFNNIADLILEDRMAKNEKTAKEFLKGLKEKVQAQFDREKIELYEFRKKIEGNGAPQLKPWDIAYYEEKQRKALYDFDSEVLRPYFSYEKVLKGMFDIAEQLFGIKLEKLRGYSVWDNLVETYGAFDADGTLIGSFYTDFFPRENKRGGAWMDCFISGLRKEDGFIPHHGIIAGNFTPAIGEKPSLLTHDEVCTTFHEFGHWLHQCLSKVDIRSLAGTNVSWDFVEFPSQIMENWCWEREALDMFARHYQNDSPIPPDLYDKMVRARNFRSGTYFMRQLGLGMLDLALHTEYDPSVHGDIIGYSRKILQEYLPAKLEDDYSMLSSFTHLFDDPIGYAAGYYSYKWSEALDADAFSRFQEEGILNSNTGKAFRETVLSKGNSEDPKILFESFMGRELNSNALLKRSGINP